MHPKSLGATCRKASLGLINFFYGLGVNAPLFSNGGDLFKSKIDQYAVTYFVGAACSWRIDLKNVFIWQAIVKAPVISITGAIFKTISIFIYFRISDDV